MLKLIEENIPECLKNNRKWVGITVNDEGRKIPIDPKPTAFGACAKSNDPETWGSFEQAVKTVEVGLCVTIAYAMTKEDGLIFIDVDYHAGKLETAEEKLDLEKKFKAMCSAIKPFETYQEKSISGEGVHLLAKGVLDERLSTGQSTLMPIEIYNEKFITMTGHKINEFDIDDSERTIRGIQNLHRHYFKIKTSTALVNGDNTIVSPADGQRYEDNFVLQVALKNEDFQLLWNNQWEQVKDKEGQQKYSQQHYADFALIKRLTFYTGNCPSQVERLFRQSPCYQAYGKNGKWAKYDSDIQKDIQSASGACTDVYTPPSVGVVQNNSGLWQPDFAGIYKLLVGAAAQRPLKNPILISMVQDYILKYQYQKGIIYIPYLFKEDRNINGCTNIVRKYYGDSFKYSLNFNGYYIWKGKQYIDYGDSEILIHPITEALALVEHSVFHWVMNEVVNADDTAEIAPSKNPKEAGLTQKDLMEEKAIHLFQESKKYVDSKLAKDVLKKYKGMSVGDDLLGYYGTPYINMENGVLNLTTRELLPHDPIYNQYKITSCSYDPSADCPEFEAMMARLIPAEDERKELQKSFGLCLAKKQLPAKKVLMLLVGPKDSGKTTVLNTIVELLGEYGTSVDNSVLMQNGKEKNKGPEMYDFRETLMITTSESNENDKLDTGRVKALTGETMLSVKNNYATRMDKFKMIGLIYIDSNFKPYIPPKDTATWGRIRIFPFLCPVTTKDPDLKNKLNTEKAGIFNWMLKGLDMVAEEKEIFETPEMLAYKEQYKGEMDTIEQFINECTEKSDNGSDRVLTSMLHTTYKNWCRDNGFRDSIRNKFYEDVSKYFSRKKSGSEYFAGMTLTPLGSLYSHMTEKTAQQFAKDKRSLLETPTVEMGYGVLRKTYFMKSKAWFAKNIEFQDDIPMLEGRYVNYCEWCIEQGIIPLKVSDFNSKVHYLRDNLTTSTPTPELLEKAATIWGS